MLFESIILIVFVISFGGILLILIHKMPALVFLPKNGIARIKDHKLVLGCRNKVKKISLAFEKQIFLHKILSWIKVITLKIETRVDHLLHKIRKKNQQVDKDNK